MPEYLRRGAEALTSHTCPFLWCRNPANLLASYDTPHAPNAWHTYAIEWEANRVSSHPCFHAHWEQQARCTSGAVFGCSSSLA